MVVETRIDPVSGRRSHRVTGAIDPAEIRAEIARVCDDRDFRPAAPTPWDFTEVMVFRHRQSATDRLDNGVVRS